MAIRVGIDVGGTFTDAVAINGDNFELIGSIKVPTSHEAEEGVAFGIVEALHELLKECQIKPEEITFIAHGTTQATNALLEGDVANVGIITLGKGIEGLKAKADTDLGDIPLAKGKLLTTQNEYVNTGTIIDFDSTIVQTIKELQRLNSESIVVSEAFSVDDPENENKAVDICIKMGIPATAGNEVSKLYGLRTRTRTAVINASIMPIMLNAANMTESSIIKAGIKAPLMVMRSDGGVMTVDEVRKRPIMTILSGPSAGVAGALMYEKLTDGIFLEVGGTSTDISCVRDGNVIISHAEVGGHKTYLNSLDVRTVGIGGGSMVELRNGSPVDVGPRSAHIANLDYEVYADPSEIFEPVLKSIKPKPGDPDYAYIECGNGKKFALTLSGAANIAGYVAAGDYSAGNIESAHKAWKPLAERMGFSIEEAAKTILDFSAEKNSQIVKSLVDEYKLSINTITIVGGGGGAAVVVPHLAEKLGAQWKISSNAPVISPIGVALAMVREVIERIIPDATDKDVLAVRREAYNQAVQSGATPESVEVTVNVDPRTNKVQAVAIGATELRTKDLTQTALGSEALAEIVAKNLGIQAKDLVLEAENSSYCAFSYASVKKFLGLFKTKTKLTRLIDRSGVIRLQRKNCFVYACSAKDGKDLIRRILDKYVIYGEGGEEIPNIYIADSHRIISLVGMQKREQLEALSEVELKHLPADDRLIMICTLTTENERG